MPALEVRDPIHGFIHRAEHEQQIIDTALFQRLRRIKQLAMAALVYPGALHTRFEHSLGALHVAGRMAVGLQLSDSERRLVRLAALLHDVGHGPFSHVSEPLLERFAQRDKLKWVPEQQVHEALTAQIIRIAPALQGPLGDIEREHIAGLLLGTYGDSILKEIISGPLDADKQDYLLRDSYFCGVKYGVYDIERFVHALAVREDKADRFLAVSGENVHVLEQFILAKYYMTTQVYRHRIRLITDAMIQRGITLGIERDGIPWLRDLYAYDGSEKYIENYLQWHDERVTTKILDDEKDGFAKDIFRRLADRKLLRRIVSYTPDDFAAEPPEILKHIFEADERFRRDLECCVANQHGWDVHLVIAEASSASSRLPRRLAAKGKS